jgi:DNA-binding beta-propeller fold protein YncE
MISRRSIALLVVCLSGLRAQMHVRPGPLPDGGTLLRTGWVLRPAGRQFHLDGMPMRSLLTRDKRFLLVLQSGAQPSVASIDLRRGAAVSRVPLPGAWLGLALTANGRLLYAGGGASGAVYELTVSPEGVLARARTFTVFELGRQPAKEDFIGDVALSANDRMIYAAALHENRVLVINPQSGRVIERFDTGRRPYRILFHPDGKSYFVTSWATGVLHHYDADTGQQLSTLRLGPQSTDIVWRDRKTLLEDGEEFPFAARLFVTSTAVNKVYAAGITAAGELKLLDAIDVSLAPRAPVGMTPSALALDEQQDKLYVTCAGVNLAAVVDVSRPRARLLGLVPTGWYPTGVTTHPEGLAVLNARKWGADGGSISLIPNFDAPQLARHTRGVFSNSPYSDRMLDGFAPPTGVAALRHAVYIYLDSPASAGPNQSKFTREFTRLSNFHPNSHNPADAPFWATAAIAPHFVELTGNAANDAAGVPPAGFLWTQALLAGKPMRNYGFSEPGVIAVTNAKFRDAGAAAVLEDLAAHEKSASLPDLITIRLSGDGADRALGTIVEALSRSKFWPATAVFVHGNQAHILSPYTRQRREDDSFYNSTSMLRTVGLILGLQPMTIHDAASPPMYNAFSTQQDISPFASEPVR